MSPAIQQLYECPPVCGPALTVSTLPDDGAALLQAIAAANPGDILVVERDGDDRHACWGAVLTAAAQGAGIAGVVIDGFVTDAGAIRAAGLPVWCKGRSPLTTKPGGRGGSVNTDIRCGGATVRAGDLVLADENGVCILDPQQAFRLANEALQMQASEPALISRLSGGEAIDQVFGTPKLGGNGTMSNPPRQPHSPVTASSRCRSYLMPCVNSALLFPRWHELEAFCSPAACHRSTSKPVRSLKVISKRRPMQFWMHWSTHYGTLAQVSTTSSRRMCF